ncbi:hypothetical protein B0A48_05614 [Cryoendolithus antarcticus]|uniref:Uncharacterized protein n=1 Tax=Cryoendolithus antarcticus TaxID=1507870 RepID=A0A1V8TJD9_9PEZI|nr:hypothetical protein B0A48_05614 [Cryoendolithus antarcticus]
MLGTMHPVSGSRSESSLSSKHGPVTPPYTPAKPKRRLDRSDSPALSVHPTETVSPPKKQNKPSTPDEVTVMEINEGETDYDTDASVVYPQELEEVVSRNDANQDSSHSDHDSDVEHDTTGIAAPFADLSCENSKQEINDMEQVRQAKRRSKRADSRVFKRPHSQTIKSIVPGVSDPMEAMDDHDTVAGIRRLRRRTKEPEEMKLAVGNWESSASLQIGLQTCMAMNVPSRKTDARNPHHD